MCRWEEFCPISSLRGMQKKASSQTSMFFFFFLFLLGVGERQIIAF